jgi:hypothetical protein
MQATIDDQPQDVQIVFKRDDPQPGDENLYVNDERVRQVTHSLSDDLPVILLLESEMIMKVDRHEFYAIDGMHDDWQPGTQPGGLASI